MSEGSRPGTTSPRTAPPVTVLVMRQDEAAADSALRPGLAGSEAAADAEDEAGEDDADLLDTSDPAGGGESAASPEELEDEDAEGGGAARRRGSKTCTYEGCRETTSQVAKQRKPWMCKKHRNKMYKDKYKKKKSDQAQGSGGPAAASTGNVKLEVCSSGPGARGGGCHSTVHTQGPPARGWAHPLIAIEQTVRAPPDTGTLEVICTSCQ